MTIRDKGIFIQQLIDPIVQALDPERVVLFGSWATGRADSDSDVDLLVIMDSELDRLERTWQVYRLVRTKRQGPLDIIVLTPTEYKNMKLGSYPLIQEIEEEGIVLYQRGG